MLQLVRLRGAGHVLVSEPDASKRALAERLGADATIDPSTTDVHELMVALGGPADLAIEAVGLGETAELAIDLVGPGGKALLFGVCEEEVAISIHPRRILRDEITIAGAYTGPFMDEPAVALLAGGRIDADAIISDEFPLPEAPAAMARAREAGSLKVLIRPGA